MTQREQSRYDQMERDLKRITEERDKLSQRVIEANNRISEQWKKVEAVMTHNIQLETDLKETRSKLKSAYAAVQLYKAAALVMQQAGYEADNLNLKGR